MRRREVWLHGKGAMPRSSWHSLLTTLRLSTLSMFAVLPKLGQISPYLSTMKAQQSLRSSGRFGKLPRVQNNGARDKGTKGFPSPPAASTYFFFTLYIYRQSMKSRYSINRRPTEVTASGDDVSSACHCITAEATAMSRLRQRLGALLDGIEENGCGYILSRGARWWHFPSLTSLSAQSSTSPT